MEADTGSRLVLVADGQKAVRLLSRVALEDAGWQVVEAASGDEARERALENPPTVAVLDVAIDGFEVAASLAADPTTANTVPVFVAASRAAKTQADKLDAPLLMKPFNPALLVAVVERAAPTGRG